MRTYNPLSVDELGRNAARALIEYAADVLPPGESFDGAGVYTLHYLEVWPESHWPGFALREADVFKTYMAWWCM